MCRHRHVSHLVALYPGRQISSLETPEWAEAARVSRNAHGGYTVDIAWEDGRVTTYRIRSETPREVTVRVNGERKTDRAD